MDRIDKTLFEPTKWLDGVSCLFRKMIFDSIKYIIKTLVSHINRFVQHLASQTPVSFTVTGFIRQNGDSNYEQQYPLLCNNGELAWVDSELPVGYKRLKGITFDGNFHYRTGEYLTGNDDVTMTLNHLSTSGKNVFGSYNGANGKNFSLYIYGSSTSGSYFRFGDTLKRPVYGGTGLRTITFGASGTSGFAEDVTTDPDEFTTPTNTYIGMLPNSSSPAYDGDIIGSIFVGTRLEWIPCESDGGVIGYYERVNGNFIAPTGSGTPVSLGYDYSHITLVGVGTKQMLHVDSATYTFPDLFRSASAYVLDKVDIVGDRAIFTKSSSVFKLVDDGEWTVYNPATSPTVWFQHTLPNFKNQGGTGTPKCRLNDFTAISYNTGISAEEYGAYAYLTNDGVLRVQARDDSMTLADFLTLLTQRENNGSPSYVIYATTVETVTEYTVDPLILGTSSTNLVFEPRQTSGMYTLEFTLVYKATQ